MIDFSFRLLIIILSLKNAYLFEVDDKSIESFNRPSELSKTLSSVETKYDDGKKLFSDASGESFDKEKSHKFGHNMKSSYNKEKKFANGKKRSYNRKFNMNDKNMKKFSKLRQPEQKTQSDDENLELRKNRKRGSKNKMYHNIFMKDEYKKDHAIFW